MYFLFFIILLGFNLLLLLLPVGGCDLESCFKLSLLNILTYPLFNFFLIAKTKLYNPVIKGWSHADFPDLNKREYIIRECIKLIKYNIPWLLLVVSPFVISLVINKNLFVDFSVEDCFIIFSLLYLIAHLWILSAIMRNFYLKFYWILAMMLGLIYQPFMTTIPYSKISFLGLSVGIIILTCITGIILVSIIKNKKHSLILSLLIINQKKRSRS